MEGEASETDVDKFGKVDRKLAAVCKYSNAFDRPSWILCASVSTLKSLRPKIKDSQIKQETNRMYNQLKVENTNSGS